MRTKSMERMEVMVAYLVLNANSGRGKSVNDIAEATEISTASIKRILTEPGFVRALSPRYPYTYFYSPANAINATRPLGDTKPKANEAFMTRLGEVTPTHNNQLTPEHVKQMPDTIADTIIPRIKAGSQALAVLIQLTSEFLNGNVYDKTRAESAFADLDKARRAAHVLNDVLSQLLMDPRLLDPNYWEVFTTTEEQR